MLNNHVLYCLKNVLESGDLYHEAGDFTEEAEVQMKKAGRAATRTVRTVSAEAVTPKLQTLGATGIRGNGVPVDEHQGISPFNIDETVQILKIGNVICLVALVKSVLIAQNAKFPCILTLLTTQTVL